MNLSDTYKRKLLEAESLLLQRETCRRQRDRDDYYNSAWEADLDATSIAHCVAWYGDMPAETFLREYAESAWTLRGFHGNCYGRAVAAVSSVLALCASQRLSSSLKES